MNNNTKEVLIALIRALAIVIVLFIVLSVWIGITIMIMPHEYTIKFEMDNNTLEAVKSLNWSEINHREWLYNKGYGRTAEELIENQ